MGNSGNHFSNWLNSISAKTKCRLGGVTLGAIVGLGIAFYYVLEGKEFSWNIIGKGIIIGALCGIVAELMGYISDRLKRKDN